MSTTEVDRAIDAPTELSTLALTTPIRMIRVGTAEIT